MSSIAGRGSSHWSLSLLEALLLDVSCWDGGSLALAIRARGLPDAVGQGFRGIGDLGVSSLPHTALWPPHGDGITDWITTLVTLLTALSASDVVWTRRDTMSSLQAPGARCLLWVGPRLFFVIQAHGESPDLH